MPTNRATARMISLESHCDSVLDDSCRHSVFIRAGCVLQACLCGIHNPCAHVTNPSLQSSALVSREIQRTLCRCQRTPWLSIITETRSKAGWPSRPGADCFIALLQPGAVAVSVAVALGLSTWSSAASCPASVALPHSRGRSPAHRAKGHSRWHDGAENYFRHHA